MSSPTPRADASRPARRHDTYHHGRLREALLEAGLELSREGGAAAVVLREATRRAGVTANAAYRHFANREALLVGVATLALAGAARAIEARVAADAGDLPADADPAAAAAARLRSVGLGYIDYARAEPGWFDVAFFGLADMEAAGDPQAAGDTGRTGFQLLGDALDELVATGFLPPERRPGAEVVCWSSVHGFAVLATKGPLRAFDADTIDALAGHVVDAAIASLDA